MEELKQVLRSEIPEFKQKGEAFLEGTLRKMDFKKYSGGFGVYAHRDGKHFMIRLRIQSGSLSKAQLCQVERLAKDYAVPMIHLTTRQAIQYHGVSLENICNIMEKGLALNLYTRGAGGNYPRNVAMSPLTGIDPKEAFDVLPYAIAANAYFLQRIVTYKLPRKLKIAFSNHEEDTAHCTVQDLGFIAKMQDGKPYFRLYSGGGLGKNPRVGIRFKNLYPAEDVLYILAAMVAFYEAEGNYEDPHKARVRYIADRMGDEAYEACLEGYIREAKAKGGLDFKAEPPKYLKKGKKVELYHPAITPQKQEGLYSYYFHPIGGQLDNRLLHEINELIAPMEEVYGRLSMEEGIYFINLDGDEVQKVAKVLDSQNHILPIECSSSCIGVPICQMGIVQSQKYLQEIITYFDQRGSKGEALPLVQISGCTNSCGTHQIAGIGLAGKKMKVGDHLKDVFEVFMNGSCKESDVHLGSYMGEVSADYIAECLYELNEKVKQSGIDFKAYVMQHEDEVKAHLTKYFK